MPRNTSCVTTDQGTKIERGHPLNRALPFFMPDDVEVIELPLDSLLPADIRQRISQALNILGNIWNSSIGGDGKILEINDKRYIYVAECDHVYSYGDDYPRVMDKQILEEARHQFHADLLIDHARIEAAVALANKLEDGDSKELANVIYAHMEYTDGTICPVRKNGMLFFKAGRNASHDFFLGIKDGQKYLYAMGDSFRPDPNDPEGPTDGASEYVEEVDEWGYIGHF